MTLQKILLSYIDEDKKYYGINIYRLEKELKPYIITNEVNHLLKCKNSMEEYDFLSKSVIMSDICFPKLYNAFGAQHVSCTSYYTKIFLVFQDYIVRSCLLIIDEFIETGYLGENWEYTICKAINKITQSVFYDPKEIEYTIDPKSQEKFAQILSAPVENLLHQATGTAFFKE